MMMTPIFDYPCTGLSVLQRKRLLQAFEDGFQSWNDEAGRQKVLDLAEELELTSKQVKVIYYLFQSVHYI